MYQHEVNNRLSASSLLTFIKQKKWTIFKTGKIDGLVEPKT